MNMNTTHARLWNEFGHWILAATLILGVMGLALKITVSMNERREQALAEAAAFADASMAECQKVSALRTNNECVNEAVTAARNLRGDGFGDKVGSVLSGRIFNSAS